MYVILTTHSSLAHLLADSDVSILTGHDDDVLVVQWNPKNNLLASCSSDATARIWNIADGPAGSVHANQSSNSIILHHQENIGTSSKKNCVISIDWNPSGTFLATGSLDGIGRIWTHDGKLIHQLKAHTGPLFALKYNPSGKYLLSASVDHQVIVWDTATGRIIQKFSFHTGPALYVAWRDEEVFASCSTDKSIYVCKVGETQPLKHWKGHTKDVNCVVWSHDGSLLASCSDDETVRVWSWDSDGAIQVLEGHSEKANSFCFSPASAPELMLATTTLENTVRIWEPKSGHCRLILSEHSAPIHSVSFSPDGTKIATGSMDAMIHVYSASQGNILMRYKTKDLVYSVSWNRHSDRVAGATRAKSIILFDVAVSSSNSSAAAQGESPLASSATRRNIQSSIPKPPAKRRRQ